MTTIYLGADHGGFAVKEWLKTELAALGLTTRDLGAGTLEEDDDYPAYAQAVAEAVAHDPAGRGLLVCRSGHGMVIAANKVPGARAALATTEEAVRQSRTDDDTNILALGAGYLPREQMMPLVATWLQTPFLGGRHQRRLDEITAIERQYQRA